MGSKEEQITNWGQDVYVPTTQAPQGCILHTPPKERGVRQGGGRGLEGRERKRARQYVLRRQGVRTVLSNQVKTRPSCEALFPLDGDGPLS